MTELSLRALERANISTEQPLAGGVLMKSSHG